MKKVGTRLRVLREGIGLSQTKFAEVIGSTQSSINRYENGQSEPTVELLRKYADYFDVSMDYIYGRTEDPHGKYYACEAPKVGMHYAEIDKFLEMCFEPGTIANKRLKESLKTMMQEEDANV